MYVRAYNKIESRVIVSNNENMKYLCTVWLKRIKENIK